MDKNQETKHMADEKPKIIVDDDWKTQAQKEKEQLSEDIKAKSESQTASQEGSEGGQEGQQLPEATFSTLANMLLTNAIMALGGVEDPKTKKRIVDLPIAKFYIDNLEVLQEKTKGNLTDEEAKFIEGSLYEMRMAFVHILQSAQKNSSEEKKESDSKPTAEKEK